MYCQAINIFIIIGFILNPHYKHVVVEQSQLRELLKLTGTERSYTQLY